MDLSILSQFNYTAVVASSCIFFIIGSLWFSPLLFSSIWIKELKDHNVKLTEPSTNVLVSKMLLTFSANFVASLAMAYLVNLTNSTSAISGLCLGITAVFGFVLTSIGSVFIWENRSLKLFFIDAGYPALGIIISAIILSVWR